MCVVCVHCACLSPASTRHANYSLYLGLCGCRPCALCVLAPCIHPHPLYALQNPGRREPGPFLTEADRVPDGGAAVHSVVGPGPSGCHRVVGAINHVCTAGTRLSPFRSSCNRPGVGRGGRQPLRAGRWPVHDMGKRRAARSLDYALCTPSGNTSSSTGCHYTEDKAGRKGRPRSLTQIPGASHRTSTSTGTSSPNGDVSLPTNVTTT
jgi:hypothetical protein